MNTVRGLGLASGRMLASAAMMAAIVSTAAAAAPAQLVNAQMETASGADLAQDVLFVDEHDPHGLVALQRIGDRLGYA